MDPALFTRGFSVSKAASLGLAALLILLTVGCGGRRSKAPRQVPVTTVSAPSTPTVIGAEPVASSVSQPAPPPPVAVAEAPPPPAPVRQLPNDDEPEVRDQFGFDGERYLGLLTPDEVDILRLRARGDTASHLSRFLSTKEKENLRRRAAELTEIGVEPLRIGE